MSRGLSEVQAAQNLEHYGWNSIDIEVKPVWALLFEEVSFTSDIQLLLHLSRR